MNEHPFPAYRFVVTLYPGDTHLPADQAALLPLTPQGAFQQVTGLGAELEIMPYSEGGVNDFVHQLPVRHSWSTISLRRGIAQDLGLWQWYTIGLSQSLGARRDGAIILLKPDGVPAIAWLFRGGLAVKWTGPELNAEQDSIAIEGLDIAHEGLMRLPL
jgi:phage tail-like protein